MWGIDGRLSRPEIRVGLDTTHLAFVYHGIAEQYAFWPIYRYTVGIDPLTEDNVIYDSFGE
ncbi:hypothetical protein AA0481_0550 [Acetobacter orientalis NRIC 0481]|uniref:Uncharacterized protein n=1 Tax=Acetobacter orientalis TaxID=146474 RepID=A0A0D6NMT4_9PROT|nr:hypothetical protein Abor_031_089 [Acetobacter orientalis]GBR14198.1 hypothetical protein AA0481_0550 [Acetobacter orientalis NRIC 0481]GEL60832.1 hypothetical protein AOR02nite_06740 [Acetobacter orientalis]